VSAKIKEASAAMTRDWGLTPCGRECISEKLEVIGPFLGDRAIDGVLAQRKVTDKHCGVAEGTVERIRVVNSAARCNELKSASRTFGQCPVIMEETGQIV
jgi:hypothetical protein